MGPQDVKTQKLWKIQIWAVVKNGDKVEHTYDI